MSIQTLGCFRYLSVDKNQERTNAGLMMHAYYTHIKFANVIIKYNAHSFPNVLQSLQHPVVLKQIPESLVLQTPAKLRAK